MKGKVKDFDYYLPPELIAQKPVKPRDHSRLLLLNKKTGEIAHRHFYDLADNLSAGDVLVLNDSRVFPARLIGYKSLTGGRVEIFLHRVIKSSLWECLLKGRAGVNGKIVFSHGLEATLVKDNEDGTWQVKFNIQGAAFKKIIEEIGLVPLPPYIKRPIKTAKDKSDYQTVFANSAKVGSVAAPTAGLHFTKRLLNKIEKKGVIIVYVTLHVGLGTFAPMKVDDIDKHKMHGEFISVSAKTIKVLRQARQESRRIIAVGTTSARTLESLDLSRPGRQQTWTNIFIYPGYHFRNVDALVTNFHLPCSTLLMLVSALAGKSNIDKAYHLAILHKYRFFSYGDAMFIS